MTDQNKQNPETITVYKWSYADQTAFDEKQKKKKARRGAWTWAIAMIVAFGLCLSMLAGVLVWYSASGRAALADGVLGAGEVAEIVNPSIVLIYSENDRNYCYGTGFFIRADGYIATNYHIIEGYDRIEVTLYSAKRLPALVVGYDKESDLAVLKIEANHYPVATIGDSDTLSVGDTAIALGHPSGAPGAWSTTQGIVSALDRITNDNDNHHMIQFDAAVNPGNSGGPLCNDRAEVIGIVTRKMADHEGFGLAIPINDAIRQLNEIISENER